MIGRAFDWGSGHSFVSREPIAPDGGRRGAPTSGCRGRPGGSRRPSAVASTAPGTGERRGTGRSAGPRSLRATRIWLLGTRASSASATCLPRGVASSADQVLSQSRSRGASGVGSWGCAAQRHPEDPPERRVEPPRALRLDHEPGRLQHRIDGLMIVNMLVIRFLPVPPRRDDPHDGFRRRVGHRDQVPRVRPADPDQLLDEPGGVVNVFQDLGADHRAGGRVGQGDRVAAADDAAPGAGGRPLHRRLGQPDALRVDIDADHVGPLLTRIGTDSPFPAAHIDHRVRPRRSRNRGGAPPRRAGAAEGTSLLGPRVASVAMRAAPSVEDPLDRSSLTRCGQGPGPASVLRPGGWRQALSIPPLGPLG